MGFRFLVAASSTLIPLLSGAVPGGDGGVRAERPGHRMEADTVYRVRLLDPPASIAAGLTADSVRPHVVLGLRRIPVEVDGAVAFPGSGAAPLLAPAARRVDPDGLLVWMLRSRVRDWGREVPDSSLFLPPPPLSPVALRGMALPPGSAGFVTDFADLALRVTSRVELGGDWTRFEPCDERYRASCQPTLVPRLSPDMQFGVQVAGSIADRIEVDVDFDQSRELDAGNRINLSYRGAEDDILKNLEVGDVDFRLPASRFLTEGIPAGNFGFQADGQLGPLDFQTVWAQQRGNLTAREFRLAGVGDQRGFVQQDSLVLDDADYVQGQFFFIVDPAELTDFPHVDVLGLDQASAPPSVAPGALPIQLFRFEDDPVLRQQVEGFIQADAVADRGGVSVEESGWFRYLQPGVDYYTHPSGLWVALRTPLRREEMLAVTYVTATGDTLGDYNPERIHNAGGRPRLRLLKGSGANHQPGRPTWNMEFHHVYRVSGSRDVEPGSVGMTISLGERSAGRTFKRTPSGRDVTFLQLFGLDEESPLDEMDPSFLFSPGEDVFQLQPPVQGTFVVFPTLRPFSAPPPVPSRGLTAVATAQILADDANHLIYEEEDPFERENSGRFRLDLSYRLRSQGVISSFSLGAIGIREGSERIYLGDRLLTRGVDYEIDYDVGQVSLVDAEQLFTTDPDAPIRTLWEQRSLFQVAPTQVFGLRTHAALGRRAGLDFLGLYQQERSLVTRPQLGTEPRAALLGGVSGEYSGGAEWFDYLLGGIPGVRFDGGSAFSVQGEVAFSLPNPNTRSEVFVDDFDGANELSVSLRAEEWLLGSAPSALDGAEALLPAGATVANAAPVVWQDSWIVQSPLGDSVGVHEGYFPRQDIDNQIRVAGSDIREAGLTLSLGGGVAAPSWRSVSTILSRTGLDLNRTEFLEFYVADGAGTTLLVDLGTVSEDAFFVDAGGNVQGTKAGTGERWGIGHLDQEADPGRGEIWSTASDQDGVWDERCTAEPGRIYPRGDLRAVCTRGNGRPDTEDLDEDGNLDTVERHLRFVVRLDGSSPFLERTTAATGTAFQLYRIPIRSADGFEIGGSLNEADLRSVRHLRVTAVGTDAARLTLARMRLVGSRWVKRAGDGTFMGIVGDTVAGLGRVEVSTVSRVTEGDAYASPPEVLEELVDPTSAFAGGSVEFNEKSLGLAFEGIPMGGRAEVYHRFPQRPRNFLDYRQARLWVLARSGDFGPDRPHFFFLKVGTDPENFYLFRTPLGAPTGGGGVDPTDWLPEVVVDFGQWLELRREAEEVLLADPRGPGDPPVVVWAADSAYAVVLRDRGRAPNLAGVREVSMGVWNEGPTSLDGEIWVDEFRLDRAVRDGGVATSFQADFDGAGVVSTRVSMSSRGAFFRQLRDEASFQTERTLDLTSTLRLDRFVPADWGIDLPVTFSLSRYSEDPTFLSRSDLRADRIQNLRRTHSSRRRVGISFHKRTRSVNPLVGIVVDGLDARMSVSSTSGSTVTSELEGDAFDAGLDWSRRPRSRDFSLVPGFLRGVVAALLPGFLEDPLLESRLRWTPDRLAVGTSYSRQESRIVRFDRIVRRPDDSLAAVRLAPREALETAAMVAFTPLRSLSAEVTLLSIRDLLPADRAVSDARVVSLLEEERWSISGLDLGWETDRSIRTRLGFRPRIFPWLRHDVDFTTVYRGDRNANFIERDVVGTDTLFFLTRNARGQRDLRAVFALDPSVLAGRLLDPGGTGGGGGVVRRMLRSVRPLSATYQDGIHSRFDRDRADPTLEYQLGYADPFAFRVQEGDTAATFTDRTSWTLGSGVQLLGSMGVDVAFQRVEAATLDTRSGRDLVQERWPDVRVALPPVSLPEGWGVERLNLSTGYSRNTRELLFGGQGLQRRYQEDRQVPVEVSVTWVGSLVTSYRATLRSGGGEDPTGDTEQNRWTHRLAVSSRFLPPGGLADRLDRPVRFSFLVGYTSETDCRTTVARAECVPYLDQVRKSMSVSLDTSVGGMEVGFQASYDDRQSFVGRQTGSTQFQVGIFGQFQIAAGTLPVGFGR
ncbi:MAG: hypothetical protein OEZ65_03030 [Gemmatimonadota bacterium]|nr:hypothetical protein [Gemmatimonadota bacterium]